MAIYFASIFLGETVHAQALGFTDYIMKYVRAETEEQALDLIRQWSQALNVKIKKASFSVAKAQELKSYTFPEQILGIQEGEWVEIHRARGYPEEWIQADIAKFRDMQKKTSAREPIAA